MKDKFTTMFGQFGEGQPIHSDPAGEDAEIEKEIIDFVDKTMTHMLLSSEQYVRERKRMLSQMQKVFKLLCEPPTPQTGRTYTEGEVFKMLEELAYEVNQNGYGGHSITHPFVKKWFHDYLKQNPKP